jgi:hypothetical protein
MQQPKEPFYQKTTEEREALLRQHISQGEVRCFFCGKMFFKGTLGPGTDIEPKCPRCKRNNKITVF